MTSYNKRFFAGQADGSLAAARAVLPLIWERVSPARVLDLGCGTGGWLKTALDLGAQSVLGIDGSYVAAGQLVIPPSSFLPADLEGRLPPSSGDFDLAICVEVLEHLSPAAGKRAVAWLCQQAPVILFSAAVPGQVGRTHINEDWLSNWRRLFQAHGYELYDIVRPAIWTNPDVAFWYRQNIVVFALPADAARHGFGLPAGEMVDVIHPLLHNGNSQRFQRYYRTSPAGVLRRLFERLTGRPPRHAPPGAWPGAQQ